MMVVRALLIWVVLVGVAIANGAALLADHLDHGARRDADDSRDRLHPPGRRMNGGGTPVAALVAAFQLDATHRGPAVLEAMRRRITDGG